MQAAPAWATTYNRFVETNLESGIGLGGQLFIAQNDMVIYADRSEIGNTTTVRGIIKKGELYIKDSYDYYDSSEAGNHNYVNTYQCLGDAKSILGSSSSTGLSEEQKTIIKDLIANWPGLCRLVEKFNERIDDNDEYEKKT